MPLRTYLILAALAALILACNGNGEDFRRLVRNAQNGYPSAPYCEIGCPCGDACISCREVCYH
jgi:hypothetical protein